MYEYQFSWNLINAYLNFFIFKYGDSPITMYFKSPLTFSQHPIIKKYFCQYSNMNFWCFLVTPDDQHIITSSISASAASVLQQHWCINTNSISVSAESVHQQHTCIISISTSIASPHQQRHCISSILTSAVSAHHHLCLLYTSPSPRDRTRSRMPSSA